MANNRKYDGINKFMFWLATAAIGSMMAMQTFYLSRVNESASKGLMASSLNLSALVNVNEKMVGIKDNQEKQQQSIGNIEKQVIKLCERSKMRYPNSGECD